MQNCLCVGAAAAGGTKCRGVCSDQRADAHVGPSVIGIVLQIPRLPTGKGFQNLGFGALLVTFPALEK